MADRRVTKTDKDRNGDILALCNGDAVWVRRTKADAIRDIERGDHTYYVRWPDKRTEVRVVSDRLRGKYLRTDRDDTERNNLRDLPDC